MEPVTEAVRQVEDATARAHLAAEEEAARRERVEAAHALASESARRIEEYEARLAESVARLEGLDAWREQTAGERAALVEQLGALEHRLSSAEGRLPSLSPPPDPPATPAPSPSATIVSVSGTPEDGGNPSPPAPPAHRGVRLLRRRNG